jgi:hypothetical protein
MRIRSALVIFATLIGFAGAADIAIMGVSVDPRDRQVTVRMSIVDPPIHTGQSAGAEWSVEIDDSNGKPIPGTAVTTVDIGRTPAPIRAPTNEIILTLSPSLTLNGWTAAIVTYKDGSSKTYHFVGQPADKPKTIVGADSKDNADIYVNGSYSPGIHSPAQYSYDVAIGYGLPYFSQYHPARGRLGFSVTGAADKRPNLDPDSYYAGAFWQAYPVRMPHGPLQGILFQLDSGGELTRKKLGDANTKTSNFLAPAPRFEFPVRLYPWPGHSVTGVFLTVRPILGLDWGHNFQNPLQPEGSGLMARRMAGGDFLLTYKPKKLFLYSLSISSSWRGRYPWRKEIDTTSVYNPTKLDFDYTFKLTTKPRNDVSSKLDWKWTEFFGLTLAHELGAVPPLFNYVDHSVTLGLTFSGSFAKDGVQRHQ